MPRVSSIPERRRSSGVLGRVLRQRERGRLGDHRRCELFRGLFWESVNAAGALQAPMLLSIWDDGYGISVPTEFHITKGHLSSILEASTASLGTKKVSISTRCGDGITRVSVKIYAQAAEIVRREHVPAIVHVTELTQPLGHSTRVATSDTSRPNDSNGSGARLPGPDAQWMIERRSSRHDELGKLEERRSRFGSRAAAPGLG